LTGACLAGKLGCNGGDGMEDLNKAARQEALEEAQREFNKDGERPKNRRKNLGDPYTELLYKEIIKERDGDLH
jgi:hypothetical protein